MIHIKYKIWFALRVEVEAAAGDSLDLCSLQPTSNCLQQLSKQRILVKHQPGMLTHLIEVFADGPDADKPIYNPPTTTAFRYQLLDNGGRFQAASNIATLDPSNYQVYLSNNAANKVGSNLYTHRSGNAAGVDDRVFRGMFSDVQAGSLAIIDIFQNQLVAADYRLRDGSGKCREPVFTIRFAKHP